MRDSNPRPLAPEASGEFIYSIYNPISACLGTRSGDFSIYSIYINLEVYTLSYTPRSRSGFSQDMGKIGLETGTDSKDIHIFTSTISEI